VKSTYNWSCTSSVWMCLNVHRCEKCWRWHFVKCPSYDPSFGMARPRIDLPWHHGPCSAVPLTQVLWQQEGRLCQLRLQCWSSWRTCSSLESEMQPHNRVFDLSAQKLYQVFISWGMWVCLQIGCPKIHWFRSSFSTLNGQFWKRRPSFWDKSRWGNYHKPTATSLSWEPDCFGDDQQTWVIPFGYRFFSGVKPGDTHVVVLRKWLYKNAKNNILFCWMGVIVG